MPHFFPLQKQQVFTWLHLNPSIYSLHHKQHTLILSETGQPLEEFVQEKILQIYPQISESLLTPLNKIVIFWLVDACFKNNKKYSQRMQNLLHQAQNIEFLKNTLSQQSFIEKFLIAVPFLKLPDAQKSCAIILSNYQKALTLVPNEYNKTFIELLKRYSRYFYKTENVLLVLITFFVDLYIQDYLIDKGNLTKFSLTLSTLEQAKQDLISLEPFPDSSQLEIVISKIAQQDFFLSVVLLHVYKKRVLLLPKACFCLLTCLQEFRKNITFRLQITLTNLQKTSTPLAYRQYYYLVTSYQKQWATSQLFLYNLITPSLWRQIFDFIQRFFLLPTVTLDLKNAIRDEITTINEKISLLEDFQELLPITTFSTSTMKTVKPVDISESATRRAFSLKRQLTHLSSNTSKIFSEGENQDIRSDLSFDEEGTPENSAALTNHRQQNKILNNKMMMRRNADKKFRIRKKIGRKKLAQKKRLGKNKISEKK